MVSNCYQQQKGELTTFGSAQCGTGWKQDDSKDISMIGGLVRSQSRGENKIDNPMSIVDPQVLLRLSQTDKTVDAYRRRLQRDAAKTAQESNVGSLSKSHDTANNVKPWVSLC